MTLTTAAIIMAGVFALSGALALGASLFNAEWFFRSQGVRMLTWRLSRLWCRVLYALLGAAFIAMGVKILLDAEVI